MKIADDTFLGNSSVNGLKKTYFLLRFSPGKTINLKTIQQIHVLILVAIIKRISGAVLASRLGTFNPARNI